MEAVKVFGELLEGLGNLDGKLPGGQDYEDPDVLSGKVGPGEERQRKGRGLACSGLGLSDEIVPLEYCRNGLFLDL